MKTLSIEYPDECQIQSLKEDAPLWRVLLTARNSRFRHIMIAAGTASTAQAAIDQAYAKLQTYEAPVHAAIDLDLSDI